MQIAISLLGGLGMFLYGMSIMGDGLQKMAGEKLKKIIALLTANRFVGVLVGALVTAIIQSSSATTVMTVGFVNAGIMNLTQAIGIIMGANIGTTVTAQIVSFKLEGIAPLAIAIGMVFYLFAKKKSIKDSAEILIGFGLLFIGMSFMKDAAKPLSESAELKDAIMYLSRNPILGVLAGFMVTGIIQSSSASMGILIVLASNGLIPITAAMPILYGDNIGTCVTSLLSTIGASRNAKRAAVMHLCFNIIGTLLFMLVLNKPIMEIVRVINPDNVPRQIANTHTLFNILNVLILLPFSNYIVKLTMKLVPFREDEDEELIQNTKYLDERLLKTPSIALSNTLEEIVRMGSKSTKSIRNSMDGLLTHDKEKIRKGLEYENLVDDINKDLNDFLLKLSTTSLSDLERIRTDIYFHIVSDIERVSDHGENIAEVARTMNKLNLDFSEEAKKELQEMYKKASQNFYDSITVINTLDKKLANKIRKEELVVNEMQKNIRIAHISRINNGQCSMELGIYLFEITNNLERISDHSMNIISELSRLRGHINDDINY